MWVPALLGWMVDGVDVDGHTAKTFTLGNVTKATTVTVGLKEGVDAIATTDRVIPTSRPSSDVAAVAPVNRLTAELVAGPNPTAKSSGAVNFFRQGVRVSSASLSVYDASGNAVRRIAITDNAAVNAGKRLVGSWDLRDEKGRAVPEGTYLLRGTLKSKGGKSEKVSVVVGVR